MADKQISARRAAKGRGLMPRDGEWMLRNGCIITSAQILPEQGEGVVEGVARNGSFFHIAVPLSAIGL